MGSNRLANFTHFRKMKILIDTILCKWYLFERLVEAEFLSPSLNKLRILG